MLRPLSFSLFDPPWAALNIVLAFIMFFIMFLYDFQFYFFVGFKHFSFDLAKFCFRLCQFSDVGFVIFCFLFCNIRTFSTSFWFDSDGSKNAIPAERKRDVVRLVRLECEPKTNFSFPKRTHSREEVIVKFLVLVCLWSLCSVGNRA